MQDAEIDIIAVTGLGGHALGSFRAPEGTSVWLRDFAPEDIPGAGFLTYGYHSAVVASDSNQGVRELARTLLDELAACGWLAPDIARSLHAAHAVLLDVGLACTLDRRPRLAAPTEAIAQARAAVDEALRACGLDFEPAAGSDA